MSNATQPIIELQGLEVRFGGRPILQGLNASLSGRFIGQLGLFFVHVQAMVRVARSLLSFT